MRKKNRAVIDWLGVRFLFISLPKHIHFVYYLAINLSDNLLLSVLAEPIFVYIFLIGNNYLSDNC